MNGVTIYCWDSSTELTVGNYCSIADDVLFLAGGEHSINWVSSYPFIERWKIEGFDEGTKAQSKGNIKVGHDVWIGHGATILSGVEIGTGAVIGARTVVTKNVPPYAVIVGNPGKIVKYRFDEQIVKCLLDSNWWDWSEQKIKQNQKWFLDPKAFCSDLNVWDSE